MKRIIKLLALVGGVGAVIWAARHRLAARMGKEPVPPEPVPEPVVDSAPANSPEAEEPATASTEAEEKNKKAPTT